MKNNLYKTACLIVMTMLLWSPALKAQIIDEAALAGTWEIKGTVMGDDGDGWVLPHKHSAPDCGKDHTVFAQDHTAKEVKYTSNCEPSENAFEWKLDGNTLTLTRGDRTMLWHVLSMEDGNLKVGIQPRPNSDNRIYMVYKKRN